MSAPSIPDVETQLRQHQEKELLRLVVVGSNWGREHHPAWTSFWDVVFSLSSGLLALFLGVALGNVVRGVPIGPDGNLLLHHRKLNELDIAHDLYALGDRLQVVLSCWHGRYSFRRAKSNPKKQSGVTDEAGMVKGPA